MEASGVVFQQVNPCVGRGEARIDGEFHRNAYCSNHLKKPCKMKMGTGMGFCSSSSLVRRTEGRRKRSDFGFCDKGMVDYYAPSCFDNKSSQGVLKKEKMKCNEKEEKKTMKKRLKLRKALSKSLNMFSEMTDFDNLEDDQVKAKTMAEAAELLLGQLEKLRAEEKELKKKRKEEKALLRAAAKSHKQQQKKLGGDMSSSSSSSESSDSECDEEVVNMNLLKRGSSTNQPDIEKETTKISLSEPSQLTSLPDSLVVVREEKNDGQVGSCSSNSVEQQELCCSGTSKFCNSADSVCLNEKEEKKPSPLALKKIEVCMGGKCKKSGAASLLQEFQKVVGLDAAVSGCKCMGKCRDGPNVRILNDNNTFDGKMEEDSPRRSPANPLCIGVGLEDVSLIVANFFRENQNEIGPTVAAL